jgi:hypothetical protein
VQNFSAPAVQIFSASCGIKTLKSATCIISNQKKSQLQNNLAWQIFCKLMNAKGQQGNYCQ